MILRSATESDRDAVLRLGVVEEDEWFGEAEHSAEEIGEWIDGRGGIGRGVVAVDGDGQVRGFASPGRSEAVFVADPTDTRGVADALLPWLRQQRDVVEVMTFASDSERIRAFEQHGLRHRRSWFTLARPARAGPVPAAVFPDGVDVAPYRLGDDDEAVHRLIYVDAAFASIWGHPWDDLDSWRRSEQGRSRFLARRDGRPVGWIAGRVLDSGRGEITTLAVAMSERRRGLGRALLLHAFGHLERAGAIDLTLSVEAHNQAALGLYRSVGMEVELEWRVHGTPMTGDGRAPLAR